MKKLYTDEEGRPPYKELEPETKDNREVLSKFSVILLNMASFGLNFMTLLLSVEVIPAQIQALVGDASKGSCFGALVAGGSAVTFFVSPIVGMISDRLRLKMGKRRPVMMIGTIFSCLGLIGMAFSAPHVDTDSTSDAQVNNTECYRDLVYERCHAYYNGSAPSFIPEKGNPKPGSVLLVSETNINNPQLLNKSGNLALYIVFFLLVILSQSTISVCFNALVADKSHPSQRGFSSGVMGAMILLGNVSGAAVGLSFSHIGVLGIYGCIIGMLIISVAVTVISTPEAPGKEDIHSHPLDCKLIFCGFWEPLKEHDFRWVFFTRFLMQQGVSTITGFLEYWLDDMVQLPNCWTAATSVAVMLLPLFFAAAFSSVIFGVLSDRKGKRKIFVTAGAILLAIASLTDTFMTGDFGFYVAVIMAFVFGIGFGAFTSVDFALVMDVLPDEKDNAKDLAVWHLALILPQTLATPIGGVILDVFEKVNCEIGLGYIILFLVTTVYFILSGCFVFKIRNAK
ncbi:hypothetical protein LOTGIDRAFT_237186 [Lottia gigantea]|uniref:Major facilitator superfamily (MFS) profile domain-containing protein n=1 Tax=Lottia gigantea TaxID=225164 RepID=V4B1A4_LOTGI|nr:hypothetical protein LOTGIDRAFT_237186 [Lottia gigantea]ESO81984.1 hypothetical protein LOTGIDRAFT_237186 [Lottia gigantea]